MRSSDLQPVQLPDLTQELPSPASATFEEQLDFEQAESPAIPTPSPEESYQNGLAEGERLGRAAASKEMEPIVARVEEITQSLGRVREARLDEVENDLIGIATEMARRILHGELQLESDVVVRMAKACLQEAKEDGDRTLHVNPGDVELLRSCLPELEADLSDGSIRIEPDPRMPAGGIVLETERTCYDGRPNRILESHADNIGAKGSAQ